MKKTSNTIGYYIAFIALGMVSAVWGPTLPGLAEHTQTQLNAISFLFPARSLGYLLGSLFGGRLYDRLPGHTVMVVVLLGMVIALFLIPIIPWLWLLTVLLVFTGVTESGIDVGGNTLLVWTHRDKVGPFMNGLHFFFGLGAFISPIIIAQAVLISGDITWAYWALALLTLPTVLWLVRLPSPTLPEVSDASLEQAKNNLPGPTRSTLIALIALFFFLFVGAEVSFGGWIFTYTTTLNLGNATSAAYLTSAYWGALTVGRLLTIPVAIRFRPRTILLVDLIGSLVSILIILLRSDSTTVLWIGSLGMGFFMASMFPTLLSLAGRRMQITGRITGWFFVGVGAGGMTIPWVIGQLFETIGPQITLLTILVDLILAVVVFIILMLRSPEPAVSNIS